jgi:zinc/manganese transport system substrate-binding protein
MAFMIALLLAAAASAAPLKVVTTTTDLAAVAREVGGGRVSVESIASPHANPHFVDAKPSFVVKLMKADVFVETGLELESGWAPLLLQGARNSRLRRVQASSAVRPIEVVDNPTRALGDVHPGGNPHFMVDPRNAALVAKLLAQVFGEARPEEGAEFAANAAAFEKKVSEASAGWLKKLAPLKGAKYVSYHRDWSYFAAWTGLQQAGEIEPKPGIPPTPSHTAKLISDMKAQGVKLIITDPWYEERTPRSIAQAADAKLVQASLFPDRGEDYFAWMGRLAESF